MIIEYSEVDRIVDYSQVYKVRHRVCGKEFIVFTLLWGSHLFTCQDRHDVPGRLTKAEVI